MNVTINLILKRQRRDCCFYSRTKINGYKHARQVRFFATSARPLPPAFLGAADGSAVELAEARRPVSDDRYSSIGRYKTCLSGCHCPIKPARVSAHRSAG